MPISNRGMRNRKTADLVKRVPLHPKQFEVFHSQARFRVLVAGRRLGKTHLAVEELKRAAAGNPGSLSYYVSPSYRQSKSICWRDLKSSMPKEWVRKTNETELAVDLHNGSRIELKGGDNHDSLRGVGLDFVVLDEFEDMKGEIWETILRPTLSTTGGRALFIGTPKGYKNLYPLYLLGQDRNNIKYNLWRSWQFTTAESPFVPDIEIQAARNDLDPRTFEQEYLASFTNMSGRVYYAFDRKVHMKECAYNPNLPLWLGQDFNINPMAASVMQPQPNGTVHIIDEIVLPQSNTTEAVEEFDKRYWKHEKGRVTVYPDASGNFQQHAKGETNVQIFVQGGYPRTKFHKKNPDVSDRINCVNRHFMTADGEVKAYVDPRCKHTITAFEQVLYKEESKDVDKTANIEHIADAYGYAIAYEFPLRETSYMGVDI